MYLPLLSVLLMEGGVLGKGAKSTESQNIYTSLIPFIHFIDIGLWFCLFKIYDSLIFAYFL